MTNGEYGDALPRLLGVGIVGLGVVVTGASYLLDRGDSCAAGSQSKA